MGAGGGGGVEGEGRVRWVWGGGEKDREEGRDGGRREIIIKQIWCPN